MSLPAGVRRAVARAVLALLAWPALPVAAWAQAPAAPQAVCPPAPEPLQAGEVPALRRDARDHGYLWHVSKDGREAWLYGTIHVARREWMFPGPQVMAALLAADSLVLELDVADPKVAEAVQRGMLRAPAGPALPADVQARMDAHLQASCIRPADVAGLRPELLGINLVMVEARRQGLDGAWSIDGFLAGLGHGLKKPVIALETPEEQLRELFSDDPAEVLAQANEVLEDLDRGRVGAQLQRLAGAWRDGRLDDLDHYAQWCDCLRTPREQASFKRLIDDRNGRMLAQVEALLDAGRRPFVAVGSLHMAAEAGLPARLARLGYRVESIRFGASAPGQHP